MTVGNRNGLGNEEKKNTSDKCKSHLELADSKNIAVLVLIRFFIAKYIGVNNYVMFNVTNINNHPAWLQRVFQTLERKSVSDSVVGRAKLTV